MTPTEFHRKSVAHFVDWLHANDYVIVPHHADGTMLKAGALYLGEDTQTNREDAAGIWRIMIDAYENVKERVAQGGEEAPSP